MRKSLDCLYRLSGALAASFLVAIVLTVVAQVGTRLMDRIVLAISGARIGLTVPSAAEFTGFFLAAASFLALAYTLRAGTHIRVLLLIQHFKSGVRRWIEIWCLSLSALLTGYFSWYAIQLVLDSLKFQDKSYGIIAVPLWIPQTAMAFGLVVLTIALTDDLVSVIRGKSPSYQSHPPAS